MTNRKHLKYGNLIIPSNAEVTTFEDNEFGVLYIVKNPTRLYSAISPPGSIITASKKKFPEAKKNSFPQFVTVGDKTIAVCRELKANEEILARRVKGRKDLYEMVTFEKIGEVVDDMPETGDGIKITSKGYVLAKDIKRADRSRAFKSQYCPIFPHENLISDVHQNSFGDCFLLASVLGILAKEGGDDYIRSLMIQDGLYTIVRLYDPTTLQPMYIRVNNSEYMEDGKNLIKHRALWVHVLEKAYTAIAFRNMNNQFASTFPSFREIFGKGGYPATALTILTGQVAARQKIDLSKTEIPWGIADWEMCRKIYTMMRQAPEEVDQLLSEKEYRPLMAVFKNKDQIAKAGEFIYNLRPFEEDPENTGAKLVLFYESLTSVNDLEQASNLLRKLEREGVPEEVLHCYREFIFKEHRWNLAPETGVINEETNNLFERLKKQFGDKDTSHVMVVSTKSKFPDDKATGLRPQHAYAVAGVYEKKVDNGATLKIVKIRNPWSHTGREYDYKNSAIKAAHKQSIISEVENAESEIPMADFVKYFSAYSSGVYQPVGALTAQQQIALFDQYEANDHALDHALANKRFLDRHWGKMLIGLGAVALLIVTGALTFGIAPLIVGALAGVITFISMPVIAALTGFAMTMISAAVGTALGALAGLLQDAATPKPIARSYHQLALVNRRLGIDSDSSLASTSSSEETSEQESGSPRPYAKLSDSDILFEFDQPVSTDVKREPNASTGTDEANPRPGS